MPPIYINGQEVVKRYVGISEVVAAYVGSQEILGAESFSADFRTSLIPLKGAGSATFARGSASTFTDHDGVSRAVAINEAAFTGSRRVRNYIKSSEDSANVRSSSNVTMTANTSDFPSVATKSVSVAVTGATWSIQKSVNAFTGFGLPSIYLKGVGSSVGKTIYISLFANGGGGAGGVFLIHLTSQWQRILLKGMTVTSGADMFVYMYNSVSDAPVTAGDSFLWSALQVEEIASAPAQRAGEYVSVGIAAAPYFGAGIDGSKYFSTRLPKNDFVAIGDSYTNGEHFPNAMSAKANAKVTIKGVSGNTLVQMQARFAADVVALAPRAVLIQGGINDFIVSGTDPNAAMRTAVQQMVDAAVAAGIVPIITNTMPWSTYIGWTSTKQGWQDSYHSWLEGYCAANGVVLYDMYSYLEDPVSAGALNPAWATADNLHLTQYGQQLLGYDMASLVVYDTLSALSEATTLGLNSAGSTLSYALSGNFSDAEGTVYAEVKAADWSSVAGTVVGNGTNGPLKLSASNSGAIAYDGTNTANGPSGTPSGVVKMAVRWGAGKMRIAANGALGEEANYDGAFNLSNLAILSGATGNVRRIKIWSRAKSDAALQALTV